MKREVRVEDAVGLVLAHDLTRIVPGEFKGRWFRKGHVVQPEDIPQLLSIGKEHVYVLALEEGEIHEDDAAKRMAHSLSHSSLTFTEAHEGKVTVRAAYAGLLIIDAEALQQINEAGDLAVVTKRSHQPVEEGQSIAGLRVIPLITQEAKLRDFESIVGGRGPLLQVLPFQALSVGVVTTGSEVFKGRIQDRFGPVVKEKTGHYGLRFLGQKIVDDQTQGIALAIQSFLTQGADVVLVTGGMSVDPDDRSPGAIREVATEVVSYGMPVLPGSMSMLAYADQAVLMGLPGCVIYDPITAFDWLLPMIAAGLRPTKADIARLGHGGLI